MGGEEEPNASDWLTPLRKALDQLPDDYQQSYKAITKIRHEVLAELGRALQKPLNTCIQSQPQETYIQKQQIARMVNHDLRLLNLCVRCPASGEPAILVTDFRDHEDRNSRVRFHVVDSSGRRLNKNSLEHIPALEVIESPPRKENFARGRGAPRTES